MEKLNELFSRACDLSERGKKCTVDLNELTAIRDEFWALKHRAEAAEAMVSEEVESHRKHVAAVISERGILRQRAEAAEANLAELEGQEPYGWLVGLPGLYPVFTLDYRNVEQAIAAGGYEITPIYTRPAPAINLAEPVPDGWKLVPVEPTKEMWDAYDAAPRDIECEWSAMLAAAPKSSTN